MIRATDTDVDKFGEDITPLISKVISELESNGELGGGILAEIKKESLSTLHSLTHTGYQQIVARLNEQGIGSYFTEEQVIKALVWAESWVVLSAIGMGKLTANELLMYGALERAHLIAEA